MSKRVITIKVKGEAFTAAKARQVATRVQELPDVEIVIDLCESVQIEPDAIPVLAALLKARKGSPSGLSFAAQEAVAAKLSGAGIPVRAKTKPPAESAPTVSSPASAMKSDERRASSGVAHPRSVAVPKVSEQNASMTDFGTILTAVLARKWIIIAVAVAAIGIGIGAGRYFGTSVWESEAVLLYKPANNDLTAEYEVLQNLDANTTFVYRQGGQKDPAAAPGVQIKTLLNTVKIPTNLEAVRSMLDLKVSITALGSSIDVKVQKDTELLSIKATWNDAKTASAMANGLVNVFIEANKRINKENIISIRDRLAATYKDVSAQLSVVSGQLAAFSQQNRIVDIKKESEQYVQEIIRLKGAKDDAVSRREALKVQIRNLTASLADMKRSIAQDKTETGKKPSAGEIEAKIAALNAKLDSSKAKKTAMADLVAIKAEYDRVKLLYDEGLATKAELDKAASVRDKTVAATQEDPESASLVAEIQALQIARTKIPTTSTPNERLAEELQLKLFDAQLQLVSVEGQVSASDESTKRVQSSIDTLPSVNKEYAQLSTDNAGLEAEKKGLDRLLAQANTSLEKGASDFSIISPAPVPIYATSSNRKTFTIGLAIIVIVLGWGILLLTELLDKRIRSGKEAASILGMKILASLPKADRKHLFPGRDEEPANVEIYRILALKLRRMLSRKGERILIASVLPEAGKSVVAANLAFTWGRSGGKILIMTAETRTTAQAWPIEALAASPDWAKKPGLNDYLIDAALRPETIIRPSSLPEVFLVGRGLAKALPDQLGSPRFSGLLGKLSEDYGIVLVEAPAIRGRADAAIISGYCNGIILVVRSRTVTPLEISRSIEELGRERVLGIVMTDVEKVFAKGDA